MSNATEQMLQSGRVVGGAPISLFPSARSRKSHNQSSKANDGIDRIHDFPGCFQIPPVLSSDSSDSTAYSLTNEQRKATNKNQEPDEETSWKMRILRDVLGM